MRKYTFDPGYLSSLKPMDIDPFLETRTFDNDRELGYPCASKYLLWDISETVHVFVPFAGDVLLSAHEAASAAVVVSTKMAVKKYVFMV